MRDWDNSFITEAYLAATMSKDTSTQVGAVIIGPDREIRSKGYNGPCRGEDDENLSIYEAPLKYALFEHAERNALYNMTRIGVSAKGCTMYCTWGPPCVDCARGIIQSGIKELVCHAEFPGSMSEKWVESIKISEALLARCGVTLRRWSGNVKIDDDILCAGKIYKINHLGHL